VTVYNFTATFSITNHQPAIQPIESMTQSQEAIVDGDQRKENRKLLRKDRIAGRVGEGGGDAGKEKSSPTSKDDSIPKYPSDETITASLARLNVIQASSVERVTQSRLHAEQREAKRRDDEATDDIDRNELIKQINDNGDDTIATGWKACKSTTNAQDLGELLKKQQTYCDKALEKLDHIGQQLGSQLRQKDHEYVTSLKRNRQEIELLQECIEREHGLLKDAFEKELKFIEESLNADKATIAQKGKSELDALMAERDKVEMQSLENQLRNIDKQRMDIKATEASGDDDATALKEKLESELRTLEIQLEDTIARRQFESDKLEFDVRILDELSDNNAEIKKQKKRIMKGKEDLNRGIELKHMEQMRGTKENQILEDDCERIERQSNGLKEKFERFKISDNDKFRAILALHKDDLQLLQDELDRSQDYIFGSEIGC
jgi:hypothetical protein